MVKRDIIRTKVIKEYKTLCRIIGTMQKEMFIRFNIICFA